MDRTFAVMGALSAFVSVAAGAFGAHALKSRLSAEYLTVFETAARYQMYHSLALIGVAWFSMRFNHPWIAMGGWLLVAGVVLFSGSLYALSLTGIRTLGAVTPVGGLCFLAGWFLIAVGVIRS